jgi:hypothetical protein
VRFNNAMNQALCRVMIDEGSAYRLPETLPSRTQRWPIVPQRTDLLRAPGENRTKRVHFCAYVDVNLRPHLEGLSSSPGATSSAMGGPIGSAIGSAMDTGH